MTIKILRKSVTFLGNVGAAWVFNKRKDVWEILRTGEGAHRELKKTDLVYAARPYPVERPVVDENGKESTELDFLYEMTVFTDNLMPVEDLLPEGLIPDKVFCTIMGMAQEWVLGVRVNEDGVFERCKKLHAGCRVSITGDFYVKEWKDKAGCQHFDACLQVRHKSQIRILPRFRRLSPFDVVKAKQGKLKPAII